MYPEQVIDNTSPHLPTHTKKIEFTTAIRILTTTQIKGDFLMPVLLSLVTEDEILERSNKKITSEPEKKSSAPFEDPKARRSYKAAMKGRALLQRITEEKKHD